MKKHLVGIAEWAGKDTIIEIDRKPIDDYFLRGFVVGLSEKLLLLHLVDGNTLLLDGYIVVPLADIRLYQTDDSFVTRALRLLERKPIVLESIDLSDWNSLLASVQNRYPLLKIETEKKESGICFIGRVVKQTAKSVWMEKVNKEGYWDETERFAFKDITQVGFDDGYVNTLAYLVAHETAADPSA